MGRPGERTHLQLHQPLGGKADHLTQQIGIRCLFQKAPQVHHVVGHRWFSGLGVEGRNQTLPETPVTTESRSLATALPEGALRERLPRQNLHHA